MTTTLDALRAALKPFLFNGTDPKCLNWDGETQVEVRWPGKSSAKATYVSHFYIEDIIRAREAYAALEASTDELEKVDYVGQIAVLQEKLRIAEAVTENSKRAHEILTASTDGEGFVRVPVAELKSVHDVLHNARAMVSDRDEGFKRIGAAMESIRAMLVASPAPASKGPVEAESLDHLKIRMLKAIQDQQGCEIAGCYDCSDIARAALGAMQHE